MDFLLLKIITVIILLSIISVPLGHILIWNNLIYLTDSIAHSAFLGCILGTMIGLNSHTAVIIVALCIAFILSNLPKNDFYNLFISCITLSAISLAVFLSIYLDGGYDFRQIIFGNLLFISDTELLYIAISIFFLMYVIITRWRNWMKFCIHPNLAHISGDNIKRSKIEIMLVISIFIAHSIHFCGILLASVLFVFPTMWAIQVNKYPLQSIIILSIIITCLLSTLGVVLSFYVDLPLGVSIALLNILPLFLIIGKKIYIKYSF